MNHQKRRALDHGAERVECRVIAVDGVCLDVADHLRRVEQFFARHIAELAQRARGLPGREIVPPLRLFGSRDEAERADKGEQTDKCPPWTVGSLGGRGHSRRVKLRQLGRRSIVTNPPQFCTGTCKFFFVAHPTERRPE